ncbi:hypothetical protein JCM17380_41980 [Desulfosporosinus burensis]
MQGSFKVKEVMKPYIRAVESVEYATLSGIFLKRGRSSIVPNVNPGIEGELRFTKLCPYSV